MMRRRSLHLLLGGAILLMALTACSIGPFADKRGHRTEVVITGSIAGRIVTESGDTIADSARLLNYSYSDTRDEHLFQTPIPEGARTPPITYIGSFTVVEAGPLIVGIDTYREGGQGVAPGHGGWASGKIVARALFFVSAAAGAQLEFVFSDRQKPDELQLLIDHDGDGRVDDERSPDIATTGTDLSRHGWPGTVSASTVEPQGDGLALVTLSSRHDFKWRQDEVAGIVYGVFPDSPLLQHYTGPFTLATGSSVRYTIYYTDGSLDWPRDLRVPE